jgi:hypothetical protein
LKGKKWKIKEIAASIAADGGEIFESFLPV